MVAPFIFNEILGAFFYTPLAIEKMRRAIKTLGKRVNELQQLLDTSRDELSKESEESDRIIFINSDIENTKQEIEELQEAIKQLLK